MLPRQEHMMHSLAPRNMDAEENSLNKVYQSCKGCKVPADLKKDYCSIGICAKDLAYD